MVNVKFINTLFLRNLLESHYKQEDVVIRKHLVESRSGYVNRITVKYSSQQNKDATLNLIALIKDENSKSEISKEFKMLIEVLPRYSEALKAGRDSKLFPKIVYSEKTPVDVIILEDVAQSGFTAARVTKGLTIQQSRVAVEKIAALHAASVIHLQHARPEFKSQFEKSPSNFDTPYFKEAFDQFIKTATSVSIPSSVVQKLADLENQLLETSVMDFNASLNGFNVLNHGNAWTNNILFSYTNGEPVDALLIDFKRAVIGSPVLDLMFLFTTSMAFDVLKEHKDELLYTYHSKLTVLLKTLKFDGVIPTLLDFQNEFLKRGIMELLLTLTVAPYLRTPNCSVQPKLVAPILDVKDQQVDLGKIASQVLTAYGKDIIEELKTVETNGLLDFGVEYSNVKKLLGAFQ